MWVKLLSRQQITEKGVAHTYNPGDWVSVGRQTATLWIQRGEATIPGGDPSQVHYAGRGVVVPEGRLGAATVALSVYQMQITEGNGLSYERTFLWDASAAVPAELVPAGFALLDTWQVAVPLSDYETLACHVGSEADRERTKAVIRDLRVPLYDTRAMFIKRCPDTERLLSVWRREQEGDGRENHDSRDSRLAFLRALYTVKPFILALPTTWTDQKAPR